MNWTPICSIDALRPESGVCALVDGVQVAVFMTYDGELHALSNLDPYTDAYVLSRGIVGTRQGEPTVASPLHKQVYSLVSGRCLDDETLSVPVYGVRVGDGGLVEVTLGQRVAAGLEERVEVGV
ncbi:nitrite reductase small subunit NirD [Nonomuraea sp. PA05]|uniref:nitrite reductase small subunit NirD n=1 Tax=Nonomuraea sp. PA05 TaxID=2604466 RepID=UPI0011DA9362|nr:nitrite reductase small subunit NirD [Nonomuraea sp. PA05]TYB51983.1 nitrite reductase small subunit NirD [Nonomuraea sp. PA05]